MVLDLGAFLLERRGADLAHSTPPSALPPMSKTPTPGASAKEAAQSATDVSSRTRSPSPPRAHGLKSPAYAAPSESAGPYNAKNLAALVPKHKLVDFGYLDLRDCANMMNVDPRSGDRVVRAAAVKKAKAQDVSKSNGGKEAPLEGANQDGTTWDFGHNRKSYTEKTGDGFLVVRAGEETYAFKDEEELKREIKNDPDADRFYLDAEGKLVERAKTSQAFNKFVCTSLKIDHNGLRSPGVNSLLPTLELAFSNPFTSIVVLDLSFNLVSEVPAQLERLPLQTLLLHCNLIETMNEVRKLQSLHGTLRKLTLNENPVQTATAKFKYAVLHTLPFLHCLDDSRVTDKDRERIAIFEELFVPPKRRGTTRKFLPPLTKPASAAAAM